jgi:hypothetical protein
MPGYVERAHAQGNAVHVWTVDDGAGVDLCLAESADAIITNRPEEVLEQVRHGGGGLSVRPRRPLPERLRRTLGGGLLTR